MAVAQTNRRRCRCQDLESDSTLCWRTGDASHRPCEQPTETYTPDVIADAHLDLLLELGYRELRSGETGTFARTWLPLLEAGGEDYPALLATMSDRGWSSADIDAVSSDNLLGFLRRALPSE